MLTCRSWEDRGVGELADKRFETPSSRTLITLGNTQTGCFPCSYYWGRERWQLFVLTIFIVTIISSHCVNVNHSGAIFPFLYFQDC
jgi:hypothetical protein